MDMLCIMLLPPALLPAHAREHFVVVWCVCVCVCVCLCACMRVCVHVHMCMCVSSLLLQPTICTIVRTDVILQPIYGLCDLMMFTTLILATHPSVLC